MYTVSDLLLAEIKEKKNKNITEFAYKFRNNVGRTHKKQLQWLFKTKNGKVGSAQMLNKGEKETVT